MVLDDKGNASKLVFTELTFSMSWTVDHPDYPPSDIATGNVIDIVSRRCLSCVAVC
jgi:hypothetical protein